MRRDGAANRESVLLAAEQVFGEKGASASTEEIARRAQVSIATVFRNFPTKHDLIEATAARYLDGLADRAGELADDIDDPAEAFVALLRTLVSVGAVKTALMDLLPPHRDDWQDLSPLVVSSADALLGAVERALSRAQAVGAARKDVAVDDVSLLLRALSHVTAPGAEEAVERALGIVMDGLGVPH
ncbi:TetR/AcrR family transcriptional regulator [Streptomyces sp. NPDC004732]|uniref:TetR/AcrR family transcriptional regulator n=1 Tax=Streptomyces sp. NPDC004732 TaxID=3154290 RepID=UPI0033AEE860